MIIERVHDSGVFKGHRVSSNDKKIQGHLVKGKGYYSLFIKGDFIAHNTKEFSSERDNRVPHQDFDEFFSKKDVHYSINLHNTINDIAPDTLSELDEEYNWYEESRGFYEILEEINKLTDIVWYNRHCNLAYEVEQGNHKIVDKENYDVNNPKQTVSYIWEGALKSAKQKEELYGDELYPESDFE